MSSKPGLRNFATLDHARIRFDLPTFSRKTDAVYMLVTDLRQIIIVYRLVVTALLSIRHLIKLKMIDCMPVNEFIPLCTKVEKICCKHDDRYSVFISSVFTCYCVVHASCNLRHNFFIGLIKSSARKHFCSVKFAIKLAIFMVICP